MKKILLISLIIAQSDIQAMLLKKRISKMFSKRSYILNPVVREINGDESKEMLPESSYMLRHVTQEVKSDEGEYKEANRKIRKNSLPIPIKTSGAETNKTEFYLSSSGGSDSDYTLHVQGGKVLSLYGFNQSIPNSNRMDKDEGIFDMEPDTEQFISANTVSNYAEQTPGYTLSEEYFSPIYREKQLHDIQESQHGMSRNPRRRKRSSIDMYYDKYESDKKIHSPEVLVDSDKEAMTTHRLTLFMRKNITKRK